MHANWRHLEIRLPMSGLDSNQACHPERSEGSRRAASQILRFAQDDKRVQRRDDKPYLQMSAPTVHSPVYLTLKQGDSRDTARATRTPMTMSESIASIIMSAFAILVSGFVSAGLTAVAPVKATKRYYQS